MELEEGAAGNFYFTCSNRKGIVRCNAKKSIKIMITDNKIVMVEKKESDHHVDCSVLQEKDLPFSKEDTRKIEDTLKSYGGSKIFALRDIRYSL